MSNVTTHMIEDVSLNYGMSAMSANTSSSSLDINGLGDYIVAAVLSQSDILARALKDGVAEMKLVPNNREAARWLAAIQA